MCILGIVQLSELVRDPDGPRVALLIAPPGSGKTFSMSHCRTECEEQGRSTAWITLDQTANDADLLSSRLSHSVVSNASVVFIDDVDVIVDATASRVLSEFLAGRTVVRRAVVAGHRDPNLHVASARAADLVVDLDSHGLRLSVADIQSWAEERALDDCDSTLIHHVSDGWAVMVDRLLRHCESRRGGSPTEVALVDVLVDETASMVGTDNFNLLLQCSTMEVLSGRTCDAIAGTAGSALRLADLSSLTPLLRPLDRNLEEFALHGPLRDGLMNRLEATTAGPQLALLRQRTAEMMLSLGQNREAIDQLLSAGLVERAADTLARLWGSGDMTITPDLLGRFGEQGLDGYVPHLVTIASLHAENGDVEALGRCVQDLDRMQCSGPSSGPWTGTLPHGFGRLEEALILLRWSLPDFDEGSTQAEVDMLAAWEVGPAQNRRLITGFHVAHRSYLLGHPEHARQMAESVLRGHRAVGRKRPIDQRATVLATDLIALIEHDAGNYRMAEAQNLAATKLVDSYDLSTMPPFEARFHSLSAAVALPAPPEDRVAKLRRHAQESSFLSIAIHASIELVRALDQSGQDGEARKVLAQLDGVTGAPTLFAARIDILRTALMSSTRSPDQLTPGERTLLLMLTTGRTQQELADDLGLSINTIKSQVRSIYQKFGAGNRAQAIGKATELGLLATVLPWER